MDKPDISVILPVYNEQASLVHELRIIKDAMSASGLHYELIVIEDASTDQSRAILHDVDGITLILHDENRGTGASRKEGIAKARGSIIVWTDMDLTYPNHLIPQLVRQLKTSDCRQIIGKRRWEENPPLLRETVKFTLRCFASILCGQWIRDLNSGFRAFYRDDALKVLDLIPKGFSCCSTMTMSFIYNKLKVGYMTIDYNKRTGTSKFHPVKDTYRCFRQVARLAARHYARR